jgi:hypothetical protein
VSQDAESAGGIHIRNEMQPAEFRINGIPLSTGLSFFGQGLSPRFANSFNLITGTLPAQYGLSTSGIIDIQTKTGLFVPGGLISMYGGGYQTSHPSAEYMSRPMRCVSQRPRSTDRISCDKLAEHHPDVSEVADVGGVRVIAVAEHRDID